MIGVLLVFIGYQLYRIALHPTAGLMALTAFDIVIVSLTWREYTRQRNAGKAAVATESLPTPSQPVQD